MKRTFSPLSSSTKNRAAIIAVILLASVGSVFAKGVTKKVRFPRGSTSTNVVGTVVRGDRDRYIVGARAGQKLVVSIASLDNNAVFQIYLPGGKRALSGAGEMDDATRWNGQLPDSGNYVIVVGGARGNAEYDLAIDIK